LEISQNRANQLLQMAMPESSPVAAECNGFMTILHKANNGTELTYDYGFLAVFSGIGF
jgi:hypothetical protein